MTTLTAALSRSGPFLNPGPWRRGFLLGFFGTLAASVVLLSAVSIGIAATSAGRVMPGVRVAGVEVGGLDRAAAEARLAAQLPPLETGELQLTVDGNAVSIPLSELGRGYRLEEMVDAAFAVARSGDLVSDAMARVRLLAQSASLPALAAGDDPAALGAAVDELVDRFTVAPVDATVSHQSGSGFVVAPASDGARVEAAQLEAALAAALARTDASAARVSISTEAVPPRVSTAAAERAARQAERMIAMPLGLRAGGESFALQPEQLVPLIGFRADGDGAYAPVIDEAGLAALIEPLAADVAAEPSNAGFEWGPSGVTGVIPGVEGAELDVQRSVASIVNSLRARAGASVIRSTALAVTVTPPALTTAAAQAAAPQMQRLATWTTYYVPGEGNYWNANIHIPAWDLDKFVLAPGEWFSFWNDIGPVTVERGYGYGGVIIGGRSVANGALAGGICSTSTTLFNAAMRAGLEIGERANHSYYIERYPVGLDATVLKTDTWAQDMTFRNDTENPVVIRSYTANGMVRFDVWGVPDGRTVTLSAPITSNHRAARETTVVNKNLAPGTSRRVEYPHNGFHSVVTRTVRDAEGDVLWTNVWESNYRVVNGITEVGPAPAPEPDEPEPSTPPSGEPPNEDA